MRPDPLLLFTCAVLVQLGTLAQINPVWLIGRTSRAELWIGGHPLALGVLGPGLLVPGVFSTLLAAYPLLDRRLTGGQDLHHVLARPRDAAIRTAVGAPGITFYGVL